MPRKAVIFGNGLGMALNAHHFSLATAMHDVWHLNHFLTAEDRGLISQTLGNVNAIPQTEDQLDTLHQVVTACKTLNRILMNQLHWLTPHGQRFPSAVARYIQKVATRLHLTDAELPPAFINPLMQFVRQTNSHIATLNYDRLLYGAFIDRGVLAGYDGNLVDGICAAGFSASNLERRAGRSFGYYLHLHGSPLFYDENGVIKKLQRNELSMFTNNESEHVVLTHVQHKRSVIIASPILSAYWNYLHRCLQEATEIMVVGYSGCDVHLNEIIAIYGQHKHIKIIEWQAQHNPAVRRSQWVEVFRSQNISLLLVGSLLEFNDWA